MHCSRYISSSGGEEKETILDGEIRQLCDFSVSQEKEAVYEPTAYIVFPDDKLACGLLPLSWFYLGFANGCNHQMTQNRKLKRHRTMPAPRNKSKLTIVSVAPRNNHFPLFHVGIDGNYCINVKLNLEFFTENDEMWVKNRHEHIADVLRYL